MTEQQAQPGEVWYKVIRRPVLILERQAFQARVQHYDGRIELVDIAELEGPLVTTDDPDTWPNNIRTEV